jgi:hypothetical protein
MDGFVVIRPSEAVAANPNFPEPRFWPVSK